MASTWARTSAGILSDSLISHISASAGSRWVEIDPETEMLLKLCGEMFFLTRGAFDPTALVKALKFT